MKKILFAHPTGNANARAAAMGLRHVDALFEFHTAIATFPGSNLDRLAALPGLQEIRRRSFDPCLEPITRMAPWREAGRLLAARTGLHSLTTHERGIFSIDAVYRSLDRRVARSISSSKPSAIYAYEDGALGSFQTAKVHGVLCLYDLPIGYWRAARRLLEHELERWPEWAATLTGFRDSEGKLARKDEELRLADRIFVASSFTKSTLSDFPGKLAPVEVIPYGFPPVTESCECCPASPTRPLKLLFVGGLSQRKGIANLFAAVKSIGPQVALTIVGRKASDECPALDEALSRHRWIPSLPHHQILELMREHDVLVFPSLFEGFGLVITESMSQGTPVIATDRTAGPDLIEHGRNGWLIKAGSTTALQSQIEALLHRPEQIAAVGREAMETARNRPWEVYGGELAEAVGRVLSEL